MNVVNITFVSYMYMQCLKIAEAIKGRDINEISMAATRDLSNLVLSPRGCNRMFPCHYVSHNDDIRGAHKSLFITKQHYIPSYQMESKCSYYVGR